jgi:arginyl-tRNA---protein transferase
LQASVHAVEYFNVKRPIDPATKNPIEPAHKFEVSIEPDKFTKEKWEIPY